MNNKTTSKLLAITLLLTACGARTNQPPAPEPLNYWISTSVFSWQSNSAALTTSRYVGVQMSADDPIDPIDTKYLEKLSASVLLRNANGEWVDVPVVSTDFSQKPLSTAKVREPGEFILDVTRGSATGWNTLRLTTPVSSSFEGFVYEGAIDVPFRFDRFPAIRRIVFTGKSTFEIDFTEIVDSNTPNTAFRYSSNGNTLTCTSSWEDHDPGTRITLFVSCEKQLPDSVDIELIDGSVAAGDVAVRGVDGRKFAEHVTLSLLPLDGAGGRVWAPPAL